MKFRRRTLLHWLAATTAASLNSRLARAQSFPARPITIVVPFPAGGPTDTLGRVGNDCARAKREASEAAVVAASQCRSVRRRNFITPAASCH